MTRFRDMGPIWWFTLVALTALLCAALWARAAHAQVPFVNASQSITRPANTTTYTAHTAVCASTTVVCSPLQFTLPSGGGPGSGSLLNVTMLKTGNTTANADFIVWLYSQSPYVGTTIKDNIGYVGPFAVDVPYLVGYATCGTPTATSDGTAQVWYECTLNITAPKGPVWNGTNSLFGMIEVTAAYAPSSGEQFTVYLTGSAPQ